MKQNNIIESIISEVGISEYYPLSELGINEIAFPYCEAIKFLDGCRNSIIPVIGGDVYLKTGSNIEISYDNWCCEMNSEESYSEYVIRSYDTAQNFVKRYNNSSKETALYSFVLPSDLQM